MPPRTTQKSCKAWPLRQKSQIEPWLAHRPQILLVGVSVWHRQFDADTMYPTTPSAALLLLKAKDHRRRKGLNDENYLSPASRERCFLLTLPFIEPARRDDFVGLVTRGSRQDGESPAVRDSCATSDEASPPSPKQKALKEWNRVSADSELVPLHCNYLFCVFIPGGQRCMRGTLTCRKLRTPTAN